MRFALRLSLVMLLSLGLLLPRVSVMLGQLTGAEWVLLCDGSSMVRLALDGDGQPIAVSHADPCAMLPVDLPAAPGQVGVDLPRIVTLWQDWDPADLAQPAPRHRPQEPRAPPAA